MEKREEKCLIISGGDFTLKENIRMEAPDFVIACDRGYRNAERMGIRPDLIIGDFDSAEKDGAMRCVRGGGSDPGAKTAAPVDSDEESAVQTFPVEKDDTDTMLAAREALRRGFCEVEVTCFGGGRLDHLLANLQTGAFLAEAGIRAVLTSDDAAVFVQKAPCRMVLPYETGRSLSVFSLSDECTGVTIRGAKYETENARITNTFPIGVSNEWKHADGEMVPAAEISAETGILAVMTCRKSSESK